MSNIGDLFGADLKALLGDNDDSDPEPRAGQGGESPGAPDQDVDGRGTESPAVDGPLENAAVLSIGGATDQASGTPTNPEDAVRLILSELSGLRPSEISLDTSLPELGAHGLGLWAVVAEVERQAGVEFKDSDVEAWSTARDIVEACLKDARGGQATSSGS